MCGPRTSFVLEIRRARPGEQPPARAPVAGEPPSSSPESASALARIRSLAHQALKSTLQVARIAGSPRSPCTRPTRAPRPPRRAAARRERVALRLHGDAAVVAALDAALRVRRRRPRPSRTRRRNCAHFTRAAASETNAAAPSILRARTLALSTVEAELAAGAAPARRPSSPSLRVQEFEERPRARAGRSSRARTTFPRP